MTRVGGKPAARRIRRWMRYWFFWALCICAPAVAPTAMAADLLILTREVPQYNQVLTGFKAKSEVLLPNMKQTTLMIDDQQALNLAASADGKFKLIIAVGTTATEIAITRFKTIPIVYTMVLYPESLPQPDPASARVITGVTAKLAPAGYASLLNQIKPKPRKIGLLYSEKTFAGYVKDLERVLNKERITLTAEKIVQKPDLLPRFAGLLGSKMDQFLILPDLALYDRNSLSHVLLETFRRQIPCIGSSFAYVRSGAAWGITLDLEDMGAQSAELSKRVLAGASPSLQYARRGKPVFNMVSSKKLGVQIPPELLKKARPKRVIE